ncbi:MAG: hypothetical protein MUC88_28905 [Planctomycetes bacterium]|nr:hypothetical protein [Planctomycetota bacterium]
MTIEKLPHNSDCSSADHEEHLCFLMHEGFHYGNKEAYKAMVQDAQFRCQQCGRTAKSRNRLCLPEPL